jgi:hypothetical protein
MLAQAGRRRQGFQGASPMRPSEPGLHVLVRDQISSGMDVKKA